MEHVIGRSRARSRKHAAKPDGLIGRVDPYKQVGKAGPSGQVEQAGCRSASRYCDSDSDSPCEGSSPK
eukprot:8746181-Pyramimonas_sp.AAC.1